MSARSVKEVVKERYGQAARRVQAGAGNSCCGGAALEASSDPISSNRYDAAEQGEVPETALKASLGCGNPAALAGFEEVEVETTRVYGVEDARAFLAGQDVEFDALAKEVDGKFVSAFVRATKPAAARLPNRPSCVI